MQCLAKNPDERPQTPRELAVMFHDALGASQRTGSSASVPGIDPGSPAASWGERPLPQTWSTPGDVRRPPFPPARRPSRRSSSLPDLQESAPPDRLASFLQTRLAMLFFAVGVAVLVFVGGYVYRNPPGGDTWLRGTVDLGCTREVRGQGTSEATGLQGFTVKGDEAGAKPGVWPQTLLTAGRQVPLSADARRALPPGRV